MAIYNSELKASNDNYHIDWMWIFHHACEIKELLECA